MANEPNATDKIQREIGSTRAGIDRKLDAMQEKVDPGQIADQVFGYVRDGLGDLTQSLGHATRNNPVPLLLVGSGLAWLVIANHSRTSEDEQESSEDTGQDDTGASRLQAARERAGAYAEQAVEKGRRVGRSTARFADRYPLAVGILGIAAGAALAAALPATRREDRAFGTESDRVKRVARTTARRQGRKAKGAAKDVMQAAVTGAAEEAERHGLPTQEH